MNQKGFSVLPLLSILALIAVLGGGFWMVKQNIAQTGPAIDELPTLQTNTSTQTSVQVSAETASQAVQTFSSTPSSGNAPLRVTFNGFSFSTLIGAYVDFGDGSKAFCSEGDCPIEPLQYTYTSPGTYTATLSKMTNGNLHKIASATITVTGATTSSISVSGMTIYTDADFGFSFWYPSGWKLTSNKYDTYSDGEGRTTGKIVVSSGDSQDNGVTIVTYVSSSTQYTSRGACGTCAPITYYFDAPNHIWMRQMPDGVGGDPEGVQDRTKTTAPAPADTSVNTMGGLHIFGGNYSEIVPLTARNFLLITENSYRNSYFSEVPLINTIVATDPAVATPVSAAKQQATIQAEKDAYANQ
ncbi:MAG: hypothetical protein JWM46_22 [Candidatus Kaiserbacteria bacterium]|nr:hypothetical protein [Candidatus Kaiserbacteria bacterium]